MHFLPLPPRRASLVALVVASLAAPAARAQERAASEIARDEEQPAADAPDATAPGPSRRFRGSSLLLDQSMTTQTAHLETSPQQSYVPLYEWWLSLRPRYWLGEHVDVWARADFYKEMTNAAPTTLRREGVFGDLWTGATWQTTFGPGDHIKVDAGARALWPTSKASQAAGVYVTGGLSAGVAQTIPLRSAPILHEAHVGLGLVYTHPFSRATTAVSYGDFAYVRQDVDGRSFVSDQLRGSMLVQHQAVAMIDAGLAIAPKLSFTLDAIWIDQWHYAPTDGVTVQTATGPAAVPRSSDASRFTQSTWLLASVDWQVLDELSLGLGYYNLANAIAPDGQSRGLFGADNVWWSPDARVFFDVTLALDALVRDVDGEKSAARRAAASQHERSLLR